jgi:hypothetical protein
MDAQNSPAPPPAGPAVAPAEQPVAVEAKPNLPPPIQAPATTPPTVKQPKPSSSKQPILAITVAIIVFIALMAAAYYAYGKSK